jgi:hypothetical protein
VKKDRVVQPNAAHLQLMGGHVTARVIPNFAGQHLQAAALFRNHLRMLETEYAGHGSGAFFETIRCYASASIMSATASLEALINELFIAHGSKLRAQLKDFEVEFWGKRGIERKPILHKYQHALAMLDAPRLDELASPYRESWGLIELRNALVHYKPTWDPKRKRQTDLAEILNDRFPLSPFADTGSDFVTMKCMSVGCASWAIYTVVTLVREFDARTNLDAKKVAAFCRQGV